MNFDQEQERFRDLFHKQQELLIELDLVQLEIKKLIEEHNKNIEKNN